MLSECFISIAGFPKKGPCAVPGVTVVQQNRLVLRPRAEASLMLFFQPAC